ncbi:RNA polymerase factor sigma-54 [Psychromonas antarctica]|jgi:RNA polymerase sigma-54 factor|uniref:RNA polymerase factor sigma-54 n=1 Tax=Psychromonas antarctica TaxID=67573 RepID=UPI001EE94AC8|nr:RNA polymerase factor sigma-54 [Psychromonas antarctica]MCG6199725.1 RNA polymerase factor sigma-54 [Psychromonas antarctica]
MKQGLQLKMGQQLSMTPQLQQAIRLLQLSTIELQQEIQNALDENPLLEQGDDNTMEAVTTEQDSSQIDISEAITKQEFSDNLPDESSWEESYTPPPTTTISSGRSSYDGEDTVYQGESSNTLQDHLIWQMQLTPFSETDILIATAIIDSIDESGYLTTSCDSILESLSPEVDDLELDEILVVLKRIQHFDPVGIAARSTQECLQIQLRQLPPQTPWLNEALMVLELHMDLLGNRDYRTLARKTKLKETQLAEVMRLIQSMEPRPGNQIEDSQAQYIIPDVYVKKISGQWRVSLNPDCDPNLSVNQHYADMCKSKISKTDSQFIKGHLQEAKWFIKSLESRNETLLKVSNCIVQQQQAFFEYGDEAMKPMVLNDVAFEVEMHESTISRVTTQKFMHTPRGIYELKFFFSSHVATESGGECSSTAIRALIKKLVNAEVATKPLSDNKITLLLEEQGIQVARRTIAKYRESLGIPPSNQRKQLL